MRYSTCFSVIRMLFSRVPCVCVRAFFHIGGIDVMRCARSQPFVFIYSHTGRRVFVYSR